MFKKNPRQIALAAVMIGSIVGTGVMSVAAQDTTTTTPQGRGPGGTSILDGADLADSPIIIAAANALGIDAETLVTDLQAGQKLTDIATAQKVDIQTVYDALIAKYAALLDAQVSAGVITQAQADTQLANYTVNVANAPLLRGGQRGMNGGQRGGNGPQAMNGQPDANGVPGTSPTNNGGGAQMGNPTNSPLLTALATTLNLDEQTLLTDLQSGKSLTDLATAQSVDIQTVYNAIIAQQATLLDAAVASGYLTQEQADARLATFTANVANFQIMAGPHGGPNGGRGGNFGPGNGNGPQGSFGGPNGVNGPQGDNSGAAGNSTQPVQPLTLNGSST